MIGSIHSSSFWVCSCCALVDAVGVIFCIAHIEPPTSTGSRMLNGTGLSLAYSDRSIVMKLLSSGTARCTHGSHGYSLSDRSASLSGVDGRVPLSAQNSPKNMGICTTIGPRHPSGLTPCSL